MAQGILTVRGGMTSHAAVVARGMGTCCVSGCGEIVVDYDKKCFTLAGKTYHEGDWISIDGSTGNIYGEAMPTVDASISGDFGRFMGWADAAPPAGGVHQRRQPPRRQAGRRASAPRASACAAPSTCSLRPTASRLCAR